MKKLIIYILLIFCNILAYAQKEYESLLEEGKVWTMEYNIVTPPEFGENIGYENIVLQDDTIINGIPYKKANGYWIGQKGSIVYQYEKDNDIEQNFPIMDFSLTFGDEFVMYYWDYGEKNTLELMELDKFKVIAVTDTILGLSTDKRLRHCIYMKSIKYNEVECWVEGIGSLTDGIIGRRRYWPGAFAQLLQCTRGEEILYSTISTIGIRTSLTGIQMRNKPFFDLQGRPIKDAPNHGIYVKDGRKVIK